MSGLSQRVSCWSITFPSGKIEVEINNVGAATIALCWAEFLGKMRVQKRVRWNSQHIPIQATGLDALISFNHLLEFFGLNFWCSAWVYFIACSAHMLLQHAALPGRWYCIGTRVFVQILAGYFSCDIIYQKRTNSVQLWINIILLEIKVMVGTRRDLNRFPIRLIDL